MFERVRRLFRSLAGRSRFDRELTEELKDHLERRTADLIRAGLGPDEACRRAHVEFGAIETYKEQIRDGIGWRAWLALPEQLWRELRFALRRLVAAPVFTLFAVVSLAAGVGVTTAFYSVMYPLLWPANGLGDSKSLAYLMARQQTGIHSSDWSFTTSRGDFEDLRASQTSFSGVAAWATFGLPLIDGDVATEVRGEAVTGNAFEVFGARMTLGRPILPADDQPGAPAVVVLDHALWKASFGGAPGVVGRAVRIGGQPVVIVGIADATFHGAQQPYFIGGPQMWMPLTAAARLSRSVRAVADPASRELRLLSIVGRLRPGRSIEQASAELDAIGRELDSAFPLSQRYARGPVNAAGFVPRRWSAARVDLALAEAFRENARMLAVLLGLVALVLAVACTNLANLMLARGSARQHEFAVRRALGCSRGRLVREQLAESAVLAVSGGVAGLLVARALLAILVSQAPAGSGFAIETDLLPGVLAAAGIAVLLTLLVFGVGPALQLSRAALQSTLAGAGGTAGATRWRTRRWLIAAQVAVSAGFFLVAAMCVRSIVGRTRLDTGVDLDRIAVAQVNLNQDQWDEGRARPAIDRIIQAARADARVEAAAVSVGLPFGTYTEQIPLATPDRPFTANSRDSAWTYLVSATPELFRVLGVPILRGRAFDGRDDAGAPLTAVLSEHTARRVFGSSDVVGRQMLLRMAPAGAGGAAPAADPVRTVTVVGIARDTEVGAIGQEGSHSNLVYVPLAQHYNPNVVVVARTAADPTALATALRAAVRQADPDLVVRMSGTGNTMLGGIGVTIALLAGAAGGLGALVLALAMTGLFGVLSHLVARRMREMGVRVALGATSRDIVRMVLSDGFRPVIVGLIAGVAIGSAGRLTARALFWPALDPVDPLAVALTPLPLIAAAWLACYLPARRASRVDPNVALREL